MKTSWALPLPLRSTTGWAGRVEPSLTRTGAEKVAPASLETTAMSGWAPGSKPRGRSAFAGGVCT